MNLYIRYFNEEAFVYSLDEVIEFVAGLPDIQVTETMVEELKEYIESDNIFPKRYKVKPRAYFILIKTLAHNLEEFKSQKNDSDSPATPLSLKDVKVAQLNQKNFGWYECTINFKRVVPIGGTDKFQYNDTVFAAYVKGESAMFCYTKILEHLKNRQDVDLRSQFPSVKGTNFSYKFWGDKLPENA